MLPEKLHNQGLAVDLPVYHLLSRQNILLRLPDSGIIAGLMFLFLLTPFCLTLCFLLFIPLAPFLQNGSVVRFGLVISPKQIGKAQVCPPFRIAHALIENPFNLTPDAMLQCGQPF